MQKIKADKPNVTPDRSVSLSASITHAPKSLGSGAAPASAAPASSSKLKMIKAVKPAKPNTAIQHVSKHFDIVLSIDFHWTTIPPPPSFDLIPLPLPHPFVGIIFDPMDYIHFSIPVLPCLQKAFSLPKSIPLGGSIFVHGRHKATTTTSVMGVLIPFRHISSIPGLYFIVNIAGSPHEGEVYYGSETVRAQGSELSGSDPQHVLTCWCPPMGLRMLPTMPNKIKKNPLAYFAFYNHVLSMYVQINTGKPVLVGGAGDFKPHTYTIGEMAMRFAGMALIKGLGKLLGKGGKMFAKTKLGGAMGAFGKDMLSGVNGALKHLFGAENPLSKKLCEHGFEPVNFVNGSMYFEWTDFELPGGTALQWTSAWHSSKTYAGMLGNRVFNNHDLFIVPDPASGFAAWAHPTEHMAVPIPHMAPGDEPYYLRSEKLWLERPDTGTWIVVHNQATYTYHRCQHPTLGQIFKVANVAHADGTVWAYTYKGHLLASVMDDSGRMLEILHDATAEHIKAVYYKYKGLRNLLVQYTYDERGNLSTVLDPLGKAIEFYYDGNDRIIKRVNRNAMAYTWQYDKQGRVTHTSGINGFQQGHLAYHPELGYNIINYPAQTGKTEKIYYDENDLIYKKVDALGGETWYQYNRFNERKMIASPEGRVVGYDYDELGNIATYHTPDGEQYHYTYNQRNQLTVRLNPAGLSETWVYNQQHHLATHVQQDGRIVDFFYNDGQQQPAFCRANTGNEVHWQYNAQHQLIKATTGNGTQTWDYDAHARLVRYSPEAFRETVWHRDGMGRVTEYRAPGQNALQFGYDAYDLPIYATDGKEEWQMEYTPMGSLKKQVRRNNLAGTAPQTLRFAYDAYENLMAITNEKNEQYRFARNANNAVVAETGFDGMQKRYVRNGDGQVIKTNLPGNKDIYHQYDLAGRLEYSRYTDGLTEAYQYDRSGLLLKAENDMATVVFKRNALGFITQETQGEHNISYNYDQFGNLLSLQSSLGALVQNGYNEKNELVSVQAGSDGQQWQANFAYNQIGQEVKRNITGGIESSFEYDHTGQPVSQKVAKDGKLTSNKQYTWKNGHQLSDCLNVLTGGRVNYNYDAFGSLSAATYENGQVEYKNPDATGNLYKTIDRTDRTYGSGGKLLKDDKWYYLYDAEGNLELKSKRNINGANSPKKPKESLIKRSKWVILDTDLPNGETVIEALPNSEPDRPAWQMGDWKYYWYGNGMLKTVLTPEGKKIHFEYDALGRRTAKIVGNTIYRYVWDGNVILHEWDYPLVDRPKLVVNEGGQLDYNRSEPIENLTTWIYEKGSFVPCAKLKGEEKYSIISDYIGRPTQVYDVYGKLKWEAEYDVYGKIRKIVGNKSFIPFRQLGQYEDEELDGLYYNRFRYYDSNNGTYITKDPIGLDGGMTLYGYVNDPNELVDIFGLKELYALLAKKDGWYPVMEYGTKGPIGEMFLKEGELWKIGETINPKTRYTQKWLDKMDLDKITIATGPKKALQSIETEKLKGYEAWKGHLPAGNKVYH